VRQGTSLLLVLAIVLVSITALAADGVHAQETATTTTEYYIEIKNVTVFRFNATSISVGFVNESHIILSYTCLFSENYTDECTPINVEVYNGNVYTATVYFTDLAELCGGFASVCSGYEYVNVTGFTKIVLKVYDNRTGELIHVVEIPIPYFGPRLTGYLTMLYYLVSIGLLGGLAARGSLKTIGIGFIVFGITCMLLPFLGIYPPYGYVLFVFSMIVGFVLLWFSKE